MQHLIGRLQNGGSPFFLISSGDTFYANTGNDYRGEFRSLQEGFGGGGAGETLGRIAFAHRETQHVHLRSCAWLDACFHAALWWCHCRVLRASPPPHRGAVSRVLAVGMARPLPRKNPCGSPLRNTWDGWQ